MELGITPNQTKQIIYIVSGITALSVVATIYNRYKNRAISSLDVQPKAIAIPIGDMPIGSIPGLALVYDESSDDFKSFLLNFTPAQSTTGQGISNVDVDVLKGLGIIPKEFPIDNVVLTRSMNGEFKYLVGYSDPYRIKTKRDDLSVVRPLWAVSFGSPINTTAQPPNALNTSAFKDVAMRVLYGEWLLSQDRITGCNFGQALNMCDAERAAIVSLVAERFRIKSDNFTNTRKHPNSVVYGPGEIWSLGSTFKSSYESTIADKFKARFVDFYNHRLWFMPNLTYSATSFLHYNSMSSGGENPWWIKQQSPYDNDVTYANTHTLHIGNAVFSDRRKAFN